MRSGRGEAGKVVLPAGRGAPLRLDTCVSSGEKDVGGGVRNGRGCMRWLVAPLPGLWMPGAGCSMSRGRLVSLCVLLLILSALQASLAVSQTRALIRVFPLRMDTPNFTVEGLFAKVADVSSAEGRLFQVSGGGDSDVCVQGNFEPLFSPFLKTLVMLFFPKSASNAGGRAVCSAKVAWLTAKDRCGRKRMWQKNKRGEGSSSLGRKMHAIGLDLYSNQ